MRKIQEKYNIHSLLGNSVSLAARRILPSTTLASFQIKPNHKQRSFHTPCPELILTTASQLFRTQLTVTYIVAILPTSKSKYKRTVDGTQTQKFWKLCAIDISPLNFRFAVRVGG